MIIPKLIRDETMIESKEYGIGVFKRIQGNLYIVDFENYNEQYLLNYNYGKNWSLYKPEGEITTDQIEHRYFKKVQKHINNNLKEVRNILADLKQSDDRIDVEGKSIVNQRIKYQTEESHLNDVSIKPYFSRIDVVEDGKEVTYYVGDRAIKDYVMDWRDRHADALREVDMYVNEGLLLLVRDFIIRNKKLIEFTDRQLSTGGSVENIGDPLLLLIIKQNRDEDVRNIISSIQKNQFKIIKADENANIYVEGVAGSGKTMILTHRLSFWAYRTENDMKLEDVFIISPTKMMSLEIANFKLDLEGANLYTNHEFNKYLVDFLINEIDASSSIIDKYISNNVIADNVITNLYNKRFLDDCVNQLKSLIVKDDISELNKLNIYLDNLKHDLFKNESKKNIKLDEFKQYDDLFNLINTELSHLCASDILTYSDLLESRSKDIVDTGEQIDEIKKQIKLLEKQCSVMLEKAPFVNDDFKFLRDYQLVDLEKIFVHIIQEYKTDKEIIESYRKLIKDYIKLDERMILLSNLVYKMQDLTDKLFDKEVCTESDSKQFLKIEKELMRLLPEMNNITVQQNEILSKFNACDIDELDAVMTRFNNYLLDFEDNIKAIAFIPRFIEEYKKYNEILYDLEEKLKTFDQIDIHAANYIIPFVSILKTNINLFSLGELHEFNENQVQKIIKKLMRTKVPKYTSNANFLVDYIKYQQNDLILKINDYLKNGTYLPIITLLIDYIIDDTKNNYKLSLDEHYEFELFHKLYLLVSENYYTPINKKMIYIDEYQDYSFAELFTYKKLFSNSAFNYYGDIHQSINPKGLDQLGIDVLTRSFEKYSIKENYRNAEAITNYVNTELGLDMKAIGLPGSVLESSFDDIKERFEAKAFDAIIVSNDVKKKFRFKKNARIFKEELFSFIDENNQMIDKERINVLTPREAKGLEFNSVVVIKEGLSEQERYVAFTRAIEKLYVIESVGL